MEAADDICYSIVDLEDGHRLGRVSFDETKRLMAPIAGHDDDHPSTSYSHIADESGKIEYLRARAIANLIKAVVDVFKENSSAIMEGTYALTLFRRLHGIELPGNAL